MKIGELAKLSGTSSDTLRYYEKIGLVAPTMRSTNGYRQYNAETLQQLRFIRRAKGVGFSLKECRQLLTIFQTRDKHTCAEVKELTEIKLQQIQQQMLELEAMHTTLKQIADACCGGSASALSCSILDSLEHGGIIKENH